MHVHSASTILRQDTPTILALLLALGVAIAIGSTYFGASSSLYGMCESPSGKQVACAALRAASR